LVSEPGDFIYLPSPVGKHTAALAMEKAQKQDQVKRVAAVIYYKQYSNYN
jgi:hypothetical protein